MMSCARMGRRSRILTMRCARRAQLQPHTNIHIFASSPRLSPHRLSVYPLAVADDLLPSSPRPLTRTSALTPPRRLGTRRLITCPIGGGEGESGCQGGDACARVGVCRVAAGAHDVHLREADRSRESVRGLLSGLQYRSVCKKAREGGSGQ